MPFIPIGDETPRVLIARPVVTWTIIALCVGIFVVEMMGGPRFGQAVSLSFGLIPARLLGLAEMHPDLALVPAWATLFTSMFLHGGLMHLVGNMLFMGIFGDNVEDAMGHKRFIAFYLLCGLVAAFGHVLITPDSTTPMIGASGAISGVLGAYLLLHPKAWVTILFGFFPLVLPAWILLGLWFVFQLFSAFGGGGGVAWWAHVGGFLAGMVLVIPFRHRGVPLGGGGNYPKGVRLKRRRPQPPPREDVRGGGPWG